MGTNSEMKSLPAAAGTRLLTDVNVCRSQLPRGAKVDPDELALKTCTGGKCWAWQHRYTSEQLLETSYNYKTLVISPFLGFC